MCFFMYLPRLGLSREEKNSDPQIMKRLQENTQRRRREKFWPADVVDHPLSLLGSLLVNARRLEGQTSVREPFVPLQRPLLTIQKGEKDKRSPISSLLIQYNWILLLPRNCKSSCISCSLGFRPRILPTLQMSRWIWTGATPGFKLTWTWNSSLIFDILVFSYFVRKSLRPACLQIFQAKSWRGHSETPSWKFIIEISVNFVDVFLREVKGARLSKALEFILADLWSQLVDPLKLVDPFLHQSIADLLNLLSENPNNQQEEEKKGLHDWRGEGILRLCSHLKQLTSSWSPLGRGRDTTRRVWVRGLLEVSEVQPCDPISKSVCASFCSLAISYAGLMYCRKNAWQEI